MSALARCSAPPGLVFDAGFSSRRSSSSPPPHPRTLAWCCGCCRGSPLGRVFVVDRGPRSRPPPTAPDAVRRRQVSAVDAARHLAKPRRGDAAASKTDTSIATSRSIQLAFLRAIYVTYVARERRWAAPTIPMQLARLHHTSSRAACAARRRRCCTRFIWSSAIPKADPLEATSTSCRLAKTSRAWPLPVRSHFRQALQQAGSARGADPGGDSAEPAATWRAGPGHRCRCGGRQPRPGQPGPAARRGGLYEKWLAAHPSERRDEALMKLPITLRDTHDLPFRAPAPRRCCWLRRG